MSLIADMLLAAGAIAAAFYCMILSRRLRRFTNLENGVGGAVAVLSAQVDDLAKSLTAAQKTAIGSVDTLSDVSDRAEKAARHLELLVASLHDMPEAPPPAEPPANPFFVRATEKDGRQQ